MPTLLGVPPAPFQVINNWISKTVSAMLVLYSHLSGGEEQPNLHAGKSYLQSPVPSRLSGSQGSELEWSIARRLRIGQFSSNSCQCFQRGTDIVILKLEDLFPHIC